MLGLKFSDPVLEQAFAEAYERQFRQHMRWAVVVALGLYLLLGAIDSLLFAGLDRGLRILQYGLTLLVFVPALIYFLLPGPRLHAQGMVAAVNGAAMLASAGTLLALPPGAADGHALVPLAVMMFTLTFFRLRFVWAAGVVSAGLVFLVAGMLWNGWPVPYVLGFGASYAITLAAGVVACYSMERSVRQTFILMEQLHQERERLTEANARLDKLAYRDELTRLPNRRSFFEHLQQEWDRHRRKGEPLAVLMIDVDHFKRYNDGYGHQQGDECLRRVARVLARSARRAGDMAARLGGEEFVILLPGMDLEAACRQARKLNRTLDKVNLPHAWSRVADHVTLSIGVAAAVPGEGGPEDLLQRADEALYRAKDRGRHRVEC